MIDALSPYQKPLIDQTLTHKYPGLWGGREREGSDWLRNQSSEDIAVFVSIGLAAADHGRMGGKARARTARRDESGRFI